MNLETYFENQLCYNRLLIDLVEYQHGTLFGIPEQTYWMNRVAGYCYGYYELDIREKGETARYYLDGRRYIELRLPEDTARKQLYAIIQGIVDVSVSDIVVYDLNDQNFYVIRAGQTNYPVKRLREKLMEESDCIARHRGLKDTVWN